MHGLFQTLERVFHTISRYIEVGLKNAAEPVSAQPTSQSVF